MDAKVLEWVRAFFAARAWSTEGTDPSGDVDPDMGQLKVNREKLVELGQHLHAYPPDGVPSHLWDDANGAIQAVDDAIDRRDVSAGEAAVSQAATALNKIAVWRPDPGFTPSARVKADQTLNDGWHKADVPVPGKMSFGLRCETDDQGMISGLRLAGRPAGKHGGAQGQHVTAFVTVRAAAVGAVHGRDQADASLNVAHLFKGLLDYPAFGPEAPEDGLDPEMLATVRGLARKDPEVTARFTLETAMAYYVEVRDALPGASLAVDMSLGGHASVAGKGEGTSARTLDEIDAAVRATPKASRTDLPETDAQRALAAMEKLYDPGAVLRLADPVKQRNALDTFVMSMAQAYPDLFTCPTASGTIGARLADAVMDAVPPSAPTDGPDVIEARARRADLMARASEAAKFPAPAGPGNRPEPSGHSAGLVPAEGAGPMRIEFDGRPEGSIKSNGSMGDHTSSMRLMKSSLSGALLGDDAAIPNANALAVRLQKVLDQFKPSKYAVLFVDAKGDGGKLAFPHNERLTEMRKLHDQLALTQADLATLPDRAVEPGKFLKLAEDLLALIDQRPGAVHYSGPAGGKNEGRVGSACDNHEAALAANKGSKKRVSLPVTAINDLMELCDVKSTSDLMGDGSIVVGARSDAFRTQVIDEFMWFAGRSYPLLVGHLGEDDVRAELKTAIDNGAKKKRAGAKKGRTDDGEEDWTP